MYEFFQVIDASHDDPTLYPPLSGPQDAMPFEWEQGDGANPHGFVSKTVDIMQYTGAGWSKIRGLRELDFHVVITEARVVVYCEKFTKGGGWRGFGVGGVAFALVANAVSHARAAARRKGKIFIGQVRYAWLRQVSVLTDKKGRIWGIRLVVDAGGAGESRMLALDLALKERFGPAVFAQHITMCAAAYLLDNGLVAADDAEVNALATAPDTAVRSWNIPGPIQVGAAGSLPASARPAILPAAAPPAVAPAATSVSAASVSAAPPADATPVAPTPAAASPGAPAPQSSDDAGSSTCGSCGAALRPGVALCGHCGAPRLVSSPVMVEDVAATTNRSLLRAAAQAAPFVAPTPTSDEATSVNAPSLLPPRHRHRHRHRRTTHRPRRLAVHRQARARPRPRRSGR